MNQRPRIFCHRDFNPQRGATLIEASLCIGLFVFFILGLVDLSRFIAVNAILQKSAEDALNVAQKVRGMELDIRTATSSTSPGYAEYCRGRALSIAAATRLPSSTFVSNSQGSGTQRLRQFKVTSQNLPSCPTGSPLSDISYADVAIVRPGEQSMMLNYGFPKGDPRENTSTYITHPVIVPPSVCTPACPTGTIKIQTTDIYQNLLLNYPMMVELRADVQMFTPWLGTLVAVGRAFGYRELVPSGAYPQGRLITTTTTTTTLVSGSSTSSTGGTTPSTGSGGTTTSTGSGSTGGTGSSTSTSSSGSGSGSSTSTSTSGSATTSSTSTTTTILCGPGNMVMCARMGKFGWTWDPTNIVPNCCDPPSS